MSKFLKYALAVATLLIACATFALADEPATVATVNGVPYTSLTDAITNSLPGDHLLLVRSTSFSGSLNIPSGVTFSIPSGVTLDASGNALINVYGVLDSRGNITRLSSSGTSNLINFKEGSRGSFYGSSYITALSGTLIGIDEGSFVKIYGGDFYGYRYALNSASSSSLSIFGGRFSSTELGPIRNFIAPFGVSGTVEIDNVRSRVGFPVLDSISLIVASSLNWISLFCAAIIANKLLLFFVIFVFGFVGLGLIKRMINN